MSQESLKKKKHTVRSLLKAKEHQLPLSMLTCYDFQTAKILNESPIDLILVGDSVGNVCLGLEYTTQVTLEHMICFSQAVRRGAPDKFLIVDLPFGTTPSIDKGVENALKLFQLSRAEALKIEGANSFQCELIQRLRYLGVPVMGHVGLTPQFVHTMGGYYKHGKTEESINLITHGAKELEKAGVFSMVLEVVSEELSQKLTKELSIPTIGIGSGQQVDGQVLVINDLLGMSDFYPSFVTPSHNFKSLISEAVKTFHENTYRSRS